jgi:mono/diheme cytochrome c family protein
MRVLSLALMFIAFGYQAPAGPEMPAAASVAEGRSLIVAYGCLGCHAIPGFTGIAFRGPALGNAGRKLRPEWLRAWLRNPRSVDPEARMGNFGLDDAQIASLEAFLLSRRIAPPPQRHSRNLSDSHAGRALFSTLACSSCHTPTSAGYSGLQDLGRKLQGDWLFDFLKDPRRQQPGSPMGAYGLTDRQLGDLTTFLLNDGGGPAPPSRDAASDVRAIMEGQSEFERLSCASCHRIEGLGEPRLTGLPIASDSVAWRLVAPESFAGSDMPAFQLTSKEAASIEVAIRNPQ